MVKSCSNLRESEAKAVPQIFNRYYWYIYMNQKATTNEMFTKRVALLVVRRVILVVAFAFLQYILEKVAGTYK